MNRRNFLVAGISLSAIAAIPTARVFANSSRLNPLNQEDLRKWIVTDEPETGELIAAETGKPEPKLTTHVLDITSGKPAVGMQIDFSVWEGQQYRLIKTLYTNKDERTNEPLLAGAKMAVGRYEQLFYVADYYNKLEIKQTDPPFIDKVPLHFAIFDATQKYHVPLLCTPWSYTTYRGS
jgi:5-hydroxyisourate hydrolase